MSSTPINKPSALQADKTAATMSSNLPEDISLSKWEDSGFEWSGQVAPRSFERLNAILSTEHEQSNLELKANLYRHNNVLHLSFTLTGEIWLTCQRCASAGRLLRGNSRLALPTISVGRFRHEQLSFCPQKVATKSSKRRIRQAPCTCSLASGGRRFCRRPIA